MRLFSMSLCAAILMAASGSMGQTRPGDMVVDVPFAFLVNGETLAAGHYIVASTDENHVRISNSKKFGSLRRDSRSVANQQRWQQTGLSPLWRHLLSFRRVGDRQYDGARTRPFPSRARVSEP